MTASGKFIWADREMRSALRSGWRRADVWWERSQEAAHRHYQAGRKARALALWYWGECLARLFFPVRDLRRATSTANVGFLLQEAGFGRKARVRYRRAARQWSGGAEAVDRMEIRKQVRSSLYHMQMELKHGEVYRENIKRRMRSFAAETLEALEMAADGRPSPRSFFGRWKGEKPPYFDDRRKILGACLLLAVRNGTPPPRLAP